MSIASDIFRRVHCGAAKAVAPFPAVRTARLEVPHIVEPTLGLLESRDYRFERITQGSPPLLHERPRCERLSFGRLAYGTTCGLPFAFAASKAVRVSLLVAPATHEFLQW